MAGDIPSRLATAPAGCRSCVNALSYPPDTVGWLGYSHVSKVGLEASFQGYEGSSCQVMNLRWPPGLNCFTDQLRGVVRHLQALRSWVWWEMVKRGGSSQGGRQEGQFLPEGRGSHALTCLTPPTPFTSQGDSGGPLVCNGKAHGIVSYGRKYCIFPKVFTRVSYFERWIRAELRKFALQDRPDSPSSV